MEKDIRFKKIKDLLERAKNINSWDQNYVMTDLRRIDRLDAFKKEERKKVQKANIEWKNKLEHVKKFKEEIYQEHQEKISCKLKTKSSKKSLNLSRDTSEHEVSYIHSIQSLPKSTDFKQVKANVELCQLREEKKRLKLQESINKKLEKITNKNKILKNKIKKKFKEKFQKYDNYLNNIRHIEEEKNKKVKKIEQAKIERFRLYHQYLDKQKIFHIKLKQKEKLKIEHLDEKIKMMNEQKEEKRKEVEEKLLVQRSKINKYNLIRMNSLEKKVRLGERRYVEKSKQINLNKDSINKLVLEKELKAMEKSNLRENSIELSRHNVQ
jgi:hypothetical protein